MNYLNYRGAIQTKSAKNDFKLDKTDIESLGKSIQNGGIKR